jgi:hypothetical protein
MAIASGMAAQAGFKAESTYGTAVTVDRFVPIISESLTEEIDRLESEGILTGRRVPIHIPSEQQFANTLEFVGGITLQASRRMESLFWGCLKREVQ